MAPISNTASPPTGVVFGLAGAIVYEITISGVVGVLCWVPESLAVYPERCKATVTDTMG